MAEEILKERAKQWGDPVKTHVRIAQVWSAILDVPVQPWQVALMMSGLKLVRTAVNPEEVDSPTDAKGYLSIFEMIFGYDSKQLEELRMELASLQVTDD